MRKINKIIRQSIFDSLKISSISWHGNLDDVDFLSKIFDLSLLPSYDARHKDAAGDIIRHRITNPNDWDDDWVFKDERFNLLNCADNIFLEFICLCLHPTVREETAQVLILFNEFNRLLKNSGYELYRASFLLNRPVFKYRETNYYPKLKIYIGSSYLNPSPPQTDSVFYPCLCLARDNWNDFNWQTLFHVVYYKNKKESIRLGTIKILQKNNKITRIDNDIEKLADDYISLGNSIEYYQEVVKIPVEEYELILRALNDAVFRGSEFSDDFLSDEGWKTSIMRFSETEKAFNEAGELFKIGYEVFENNTQFLFTTKILGFDSDHKISFNFKKDKLPYRINALIGKNGTGKTGLLANMANALSGQLNNKNSYGFFEPKPHFSKIIAISYSVFDKFEIPEASTEVFSYLFLGIRISEKNNGEKLERLMSRHELRDKFIKAMVSVEQNERLEIWKVVIGELLGIDNFNNKDYEKIFNETSSGEAILLNIFTNIIAYIREQSLLLIDEPEVHLHPNAISNFMRMLNKIINQFDSYAVISTHSPIVIQEIPSKYINVLKRQGGEPIINSLNIESFGENLSIITNEIFETDYSASTYKDVLKKLAEVSSYKQILSLFNNRLSFNAKLYLQSLFDRDKKK
ncbi:MAG: AAA family ATPase [Patescibacteria group bacterium]|jgi:predicted ATPase